jgi:hypothetical protein
VIPFNLTEKSARAWWSGFGAGVQHVARLVPLAFAMLTICVGGTGCASSKYMKEVVAPATPPAPSPDAATVVFLRPSSIGSAIIFTVIDQYGRFLGDSTASGHFSTQLPPGEYLFIAEGENTAVMHANLAPNRLYYVQVDAKMGILSARVGLEPIKPTSEAWRELPEMLRETTRFEPLTQQGQAALARKATVIAKRIANAKEKWAGYDSAERAELSLEPADGFSGPEQPQVATPQPGPPLPVVPAPVAPASPPANGAPAIAPAPPVSGA